MSVAKSQIDELLQIICVHVPRSHVGLFLNSMRTSEAAKRNKSFAETIWRLIERWDAVREVR